MSQPKRAEKATATRAEKTIITVLIVVKCSREVRRGTLRFREILHEGELQHHPGDIPDDAKGQHGNEDQARPVLPLQEPYGSTEHGGGDHEKGGNDQADVPHHEAKERGHLRKSGVGSRVLHLFDGKERVHHHVLQD